MSGQNPDNAGPADVTTNRRHNDSYEEIALDR